MPPCAFLSDVVDGAVVYAVPLTDGFIFMAFLNQLEDFKHLVGLKLAGCLPVAFDVAAFARHVCKVLKLGSEKQMVRTNTRRIIALVKNTHAFRDRPNGNEISGTVRRCVLAAMPKHDLPVSVPIKATGKRPASFGDCYFFPKALGQWFIGVASACYCFVSHAVHPPMMNGVVRPVRKRPTSARAALLSGAILPQKGLPADH